ncbi:MAG TPA: hypothetical protein VJH55_04030 [Candidatus Paceibacterota bacterium]
MRTIYPKQKTTGTRYSEQKYDVVGIFTILHRRDGKENMSADVARVVSLIKGIDKDHPWTWGEDGEAQFTDMHQLCPQGQCVRLDGTTDGKTSLVTVEVKILAPLSLPWSQLRAFNNYLENIGGEMKRRCAQVGKVNLILNISSSVAFLD